MAVRRHPPCCDRLHPAGVRSGRRLRRLAMVLGVVLSWLQAGAAAPEEIARTAAAGSPAGGSATDEVPGGEILVKFKAGLSVAEIAGTNASLGASVLDYIEGIGVYRLGVPSTRPVPDVLDLYRRDPRVEYAEPNAAGRGGGFLLDDTFGGAQWHLDNVGQTGGRVDADIDAVEGWQLGRGSAAVVVAVLDSGIDRDHPEFRNRLLQGFDFVNDDDDPEADHPHGVAVTGILAANADNGFAGAGIDHRATILPVKVLDQNHSGTTANLVRGLVYAVEQGADVVSMSLIDYPLGAALDDGLQFARDAGAILIACAGNGGGGDADVSGPGASPLTISISATDHRDARSDLSGTGATLDLVAPGIALPTTAFDSDADEVVLFSGCSAATPVVAGIASLLLSIDPSLTHDEVRSILVETAEDQVGPAAEDIPGRDDLFGFGRVNLHDALASLGQQIAVDIRPRQCPNRLRRDRSRTVAVAIAGTAVFDVRAIDLGALRLAGVKPDGDRTRFRDVTTAFEPVVGKEKARDCTREGPDGFEDLLVRFSSRKVVRALAPRSDGEVAVVPLTGRLEDGTPIRGQDVIVLIDPDDAE